MLLVNIIVNISMCVRVSVCVRVCPCVCVILFVGKGFGEEKHVIIWIVINIIT
jgi:hypothetical protein